MFCSGREEREAAVAGREREGGTATWGLAIYPLSLLSRIIFEGGPSAGRLCNPIGYHSSRPMCHERDWVAVDVRRVHIRPSLRYQRSAKAEFQL